MSPSVAPTSQTDEEVQPPPVRVSANFDPSVWGHHFLSFADDDSNGSMDATASDKSMKHEHEELKEQVRNMLVLASRDNDNVLEKLELIDEIQRLGVHYHFKAELSELLSRIYQLHMKNEDHSNNNDNLHYVALKFRLLRQHGYNISCVLFDKFKDEQRGGFKESLTGDAKGLLSLYEAAHLSVHGEDILDEAIAFCSTHLEAMLQHQLHLTSSKSASNSSMATYLIKQVKHALNRPMLKEPQRLMAKHFLVFYKEQKSADYGLLRFAQIDFHLVQLVHQKDLATLTKWWKDSDYANKLPFTRDRIVESFFWALAIYWEPQYSLARCSIAKLISILTIIDDIFDAHGTLDELEIFYQASQRWHMACIDEFPAEYMKVAYKALLDLFQGIEDTALEEQRPSYAPYAIELVSDIIEEKLRKGIHNNGQKGYIFVSLACNKQTSLPYQTKIVMQAYLKEAKWCHLDDYTPTTEEYLSVSLLTACQALFAVTGFSCLSDPYVPEVVIQWTASNPKIIQAANYIGRVMGDVASHKFEQMRKHVPSVVECYMKEHGATEEETVGVMRGEIRRRWKDINEACINPPTAIPLPYMRRLRNQGPILDVLYKERDLFTDAKAMKDTVSFLLTESVWDI